jgi:glycosyltransferase involved in cell wall biosynthesis
MVAACEFPALRGSQVLVRDLATDLVGLGHEVHMVTYSGPQRFDAATSEATAPSAPDGRSVATRFAGRVGKNLRLGVDLYRLVRRQNIDVIHAHNYEAPFLAYMTRWLTGTPVVYHSHNALSDELATYVRGGWAKGVARRLGELLDRQVPRRADFAIALTPELEEFLLGCGVDRGRLGVVPPGIAAAEMPARESVGKDEFIVGYAGNLDPYQDLDVLFRGFLHFRDKAQNARLLLVTHEHDWRRRAGWLLEELVARGLARVAVLSTFADVQRQLQRADALVCPRGSWSGYPIKILNYMASGRAVVAAAGSAKGIVDGVSGLVFCSGDAIHLAVQLQRLYADPELRRRLGERARGAVRKNHDRKKIASEIVRIHARLGSRRSDSAPQSGPPGVGGLRRLLALCRRRASVVSAARTSR